MTESTGPIPELLAFDGLSLVARGAPTQVALRLRRLAQQRTGPPFLLFEAESGRQVDLDLSGSEAEILARLGGTAPRGPVAVRGPGRPRLGVVPREVTLLPRHWDWLAGQPGGASATLRRLIESARRHAGADVARRDAREAAYRFMSALGGDLPGFEEASRALFAGEPGRLALLVAEWPADLRDHLLLLAARAVRDPAAGDPDRNGSDSSPD
jgi:hypothetical protein